MSESAFQGCLFSGDLLKESISRLPDWQSIDGVSVDALQSGLRQIFDHFPFTQTPNENQTEDDLTWPILDSLGCRFRRSRPGIPT